MGLHLSDKRLRLQAAAARSDPGVTLEVALAEGNPGGVGGSRGGGSVAGAREEESERCELRVRRSGGGARR